MKTKLIISGLALMALTTMGSAQNYGAQPVQQDNKEKCELFVDADNDGICDNIGQGTRQGTEGKGKYQENNALRDGMHSQQGRQGGMGMQSQQGQHRQAGDISFADSDKDGICDFYESPSIK